MTWAPDSSDFIAAGSLAVAVYAAWLARRSDARMDAAERRAAEEYERKRVRFEVTEVKYLLGEVEVTLTNVGTEAAELPEIDPTSVTGLAMSATALHKLNGTVESGASTTFRYEYPLYPASRDIVITWRGPSPGRQTLSITDPPRDAEQR